MSIEDWQSIYVTPTRTHLHLQGYIQAGCERNRCTELIMSSPIQMHKLNHLHTNLCLFMNKKTKCCSEVMRLGRIITKRLMTWWEMMMLLLQMWQLLILTYHWRWDDQKPSTIIMGWTWWWKIVQTNPVHICTDISTVLAISSAQI